MNKKTKKKVENQIYESYWDLTMAWTDFNGEKFLTALKIAVDFIKEVHEEYSTKIYNDLQQRIASALNLEDHLSARKGINELVKLGFIYPLLKGYHPLSEKYIKAEDNETRKLLFSKIIYSNASFKRSIIKDSNVKEINFVIKTLEKCKTLEKKYLGSLISIDISNYPCGFVTMEQLEDIFRNKSQADFEKRKYNQISYLEGLLKKLDGISFKNDLFFLEKDSDLIQFDEETSKRENKGRDPYLQRIYKHQLEKESIAILGQIKCMVEGLSYPVLIASHIKPFRLSNTDEAFDPNNGILLSRTLDSLFDLNYISFDDNGNIIFYNRLSQDVKDFWKSYRLRKEFLTPERLKYLAQNRKICEEKNNNSSCSLFG